MCAFEGASNIIIQCKHCIKFQSHLRDSLVNTRKLLFDLKEAPSFFLRHDIAINFIRIDEYLYKLHQHKFDILSKRRAGNIAAGKIKHSYKFIKQKS